MAVLFVAERRVIHHVGSTKIDSSQTGEEGRDVYSG